jgi:hypothetical protein
VFDPIPASEPFADAAELGAPPARTELREYIEETDIRFDSSWSADGLGRRAGSGSAPAELISSVIPGDSRGVSKSTAKSSPLALLSNLWLYVDDAREWADGRLGGCDMLALSACMSAVPTLGLPFLLVIDSVALEEDRL